MAIRGAASGGFRAKARVANSPAKWIRVELLATGAADGGVGATSTATNRSTGGGKSTSSDFSSGAPSGAVRGAANEGTYLTPTKPGGDTELSVAIRAGSSASIQRRKA